MGKIPVNLGGPKSCGIPANTGGRLSWMDDACCHRALGGDAPSSPSHGSGYRAPSLGGQMSGGSRIHICLGIRTLEPIETGELRGTQVL
jgi:hypothetical protein